MLLPMTLKGGIRFLIDAPLTPPDTRLEPILKKLLSLSTLYIHNSLKSYACQAKTDFCLFSVDKYNFFLKNSNFLLTDKSKSSILKYNF